MTIAIGFSRIYIGPPYFTDVLASYVLAFGLLTACVTGCEVPGQGGKAERFQTVQKKQPSIKLGR
jgi:hypothetical protein